MTSYEERKAAFKDAIVKFSQSCKTKDDWMTMLVATSVAFRQGVGFSGTEIHALVEEALACVNQGA